MLIVIAQKEELKLIEELGYGDYPVLITGVGAMNVIKALKDLPKDTQILNIGYVGSKGYKVGTVVRVSEVSTYHPVAEFVEPPTFLADKLSEKAFGKFPICRCYTSSDFVTGEGTKRYINEAPCVFDMELAIIASMFKNTDALKVVSDSLSINEYRENVEES